MTNDNTTSLALWSDDPAPVDLLSFDAVAATVADALLDRTLDPVALGLSGPWGSGKTTVLVLVEEELEQRAAEGQKVLVIKTEPWRYDPSTGAKESLIGEVLTALAVEVENTQSTVEGAKETAKRLLGSLVKRIDWAKAIKVAAKTSLAFQLPSVNDIVDLVKPAGDSGQEDRGLEAFRDEFRQLMDSDALAHLQAVAVLVDDLDRCLPETVIESLEAIRLFLAVPKMSFVIAADEQRVADAIRTRFTDAGISTAPELAQERPEEPAKLYLHKIVQTTIPVPTLSRFDTQAFLLLLQLQPTLSSEDLGKVVTECARVRRAGGGLDDLTGLDELEMSDQLAFASRLTPILYEKLHGNPRRIKRFLNDLGVRRAIAARRGIELDAAVIAKLMVLEVLLPDEFNKVLGWLAQGTLRDRMMQLDRAAGRPAGAGEAVAHEASGADGKKATAKASATQAADQSDEFGEGLIRWAKLPPPLHEIDLSPYLLLAASFTGTTLLDTSLPERLRDVAANLLSTSRTDRQAVSDADLDALSPSEAETLLLHLGRSIRNQPASQGTGVTGILRLARRKPDLVDKAKQALLMLPPDDLTIATPLLFASNDHKELFSVLSTWRGQVTGQVKRAVDNAISQQESS